MLHVERPDVAFGRKPFREFPPTPRRQAGGLAGEALNAKSSVKAPKALNAKSVVKAGWLAGWPAGPLRPLQLHRP